MSKELFHTKYLIIGNSAGGIGAAEAIHEVGQQGEATIISDEPYHVYSRPMISKYLAGECSREEMLFRPIDFYHKNNVATLLGKKAVQLDLKQHRVELESGEKVFWERLLLACGGIPFIPPTPGGDKSGVFTFTTLDDAIRIGESLRTANRAVVIGGGLIGLSVTEALVRRGIKVSLVEMRERVLSLILDETASYLVERRLREVGVDILTEHTVKEIVGSSLDWGKVGEVILDNDERLLCDVVIVAIGVVPRTELIRDNEIKVNRGIVVDRFMSTSCPGVYACGDVASSYDFILDADRLTPIWPNAYIGGRVAGYNMAGIAREYPGGTAMNAMSYFDLPVISAGMVEPQGEGCEAFTKLEAGGYRRVVLREGRILGMVLLGQIDKAGIIFGLMRDKVDVSNFKESLLDSGLGIASLPRELWREKFEVKQ